MTDAKVLIEIKRGDSITMFNLLLFKSIAMGLSIHYSGRIKEAALIPQLNEEVLDVCSVLGWETHIICNEDFKGICFGPKKCEPVFLTFNDRGEIGSPIIRESNMKENPVSVKTQFAGQDAHIALLKFLRYIETKYLVDFKLTDEGNYWETNDENVLKKQFQKYGFMLDGVCEALKDIPSIPGENNASLADRLEKIFGDDLKKTKPE